MAHIHENIEHRRRLTAFYQARTARPRVRSAGGCRRRPSCRCCGIPCAWKQSRRCWPRAAASRVEIGSWFEVPLHPAGTRMEHFGYRPGMCPNGDAASREVINLPTHRRVTEAVAEKTLAFLQREARPAP